MSRYLKELLNEAPVDGIHGINRFLAPKRHAALVDRGDLATAEEVVQRHCQAWGGFWDLIIPCRRGSRLPPAPWMRLLDQLDIDSISGSDVLSGKQLDRKSWFLFQGHGFGERLLPILVGDKGGPNSRTVRVPRLSYSDPWHIAYLAVAGSWPEEFDQQLLRSLNYRPDLEWSDVIPTAFEGVIGSAADLLDRLRDQSSLTPASASSLHLQLRQTARNMSFGGNAGRLLAAPDPDPALVGPNLVVVYEPGSISDLCLIWALRACHAMPAGLPLAVPATEPVVEILDYWVSEWAQTLFGMNGDRRFRLVSSSVPPDVLREHAGHRSSQWAAADYRDFLIPPPVPGRLSSDVVVFESGVGNVATWGPEERDELVRGRSQGTPELHTTITIQHQPLPSVRGLRPEYGAMDGPRGEGVRLRSEDPTTIRPFKWPVGWKVLEAAVRDRGLVAKPSLAGRAGAAFLESVGGNNEMLPLLSMPVLEMVNRLCERRGMSWFRERVRRLAIEANSGPDRLAVIESKLDELSLRQFEDEERGITVDHVRSTLNGDREAARLWVRWAEERQLLIRGVEVTCNKCGHVAWRALGEAAPPVLCRGCGESIQEPYREDRLVFRYRAGEPLLRAVEHDAMTHVLAMRWWCKLWGGGGLRRPGVYGGYPGVDLFDPDMNQNVGEVDVLLVLWDGSLAVGECKRHGAGLNPGERQKLESVATRLDARLSFLATTSWAENCPPIWLDSLEPSPTDPPRYVLSGDQLFEYFPESGSILDWPGAPEPDRAAHHAEFVERLPVTFGLSWG